MQLHWCHVQGRARPGLAQLYRWRYKGLGDLPNVLTSPEYLSANPGFAFDFQFIDVPDYQGRGESTPVPYFYQVHALGSAQYFEVVLTTCSPQPVLQRPALPIVCKCT